MARSLSPLLLGCAVLSPLACADGDDTRESAGQSTSGQVTTATATMPATVATTGESASGDATSGVSESASQSTSGPPPETSASQGTSDGETSAASAETSGEPETTDPTNASASTSTTEPDPTNGDESSSGGACAEVSVAAENIKQPADIIFVIDNSGSMGFEEGAVQDNMNTFSSKIIASGIDAHVVLLSSYNICIAPPLGAGGCPNVDTKLPKFLHVDTEIGSNNPLEKLIAHKPDWEGSMRPDGQKHVVVVSDDNSSMSAATFHAMFQAFGPEYVNYKFHAIVGVLDPDSFLECAADPFCCATIAEDGSQYISLTGLTGGVLGPLCDGGSQDFGPLFDTLSMDVIAESKIACEWVIPDAMGMDIDFGKVNVDYKNGMGGEQAIPKVDDMAACADLEAWYYDDPIAPTKIFACPALCSKIQGNPTASVDVKFGCESIVPQ